MASCCLLLFFVFLSLTGLSEERCHDHFSIEYWKGANMTDLIALINATSTKKILYCTIWKNRNLTLFGKIVHDCFRHLGLEQMCNQIPEGNHKIHVFHLRCLYAKLHNYADDSENEIFGDCENFSSEINTLQHLWNSLDNDGTSAGATSVSPPTTSTLWSTTTMTTSTPTISTSRRTTTLTTFTPTMSSSLGTTTSTTSPTTTSTSSLKTTLKSLLTPSTLPPTTTSTRSTPTISTSRNTTLLTTFTPTMSSSLGPTTTSPTTTSTSFRTTMSTATTLKSRRTTTSTRSPTTTSKSFLTTQSTAKEKIKLSNTATLQSPTDFDPCLPCSSQSVSRMSQTTGKTASILGVLLVLSITGNLMQRLNSFLQKRKLNMKQKQMSAKCICLNPDATAAEKSPEENLSYSNESVL